MQEIRFDDLDTLNGLITGEYGEYGPPKTVTQDMINQFAAWRERIAAFENRAKRDRTCDSATPLFPVCENDLFALFYYRVC